MRFSLSSSLALLLISMEVTPLLSFLTLGAGNIPQYSVVLIISILLIMNIGVIKRPDFPLLLLLFFSLYEITLGIATGTPVPVAVRMLIVACACIALRSSKFSVNDFGRVYYRFTDILVVITAICLVLALVNFELFTHRPLMFSDESVLRKVDVWGGLKIASIGYVNFLNNGEPLIPIIAPNIAPTGFSAEPHAFFSLILLGFIWRVMRLGYRQNFLIVVCYLCCLVASISTSNLIAVLFAFVCGRFVFGARSPYFKLFFFLFFLMVTLFLFYLINKYSVIILGIQNSASLAGDLPEDFYNRSGLQSAMAFMRLFMPTLELGMITAGPDISNGFDVPNPFIVGFFCFWFLLISIVVTSIWRVVKINQKRYQYEVFLLCYCLVYSFKNSGATLFMPYISATLFYLWLSIGESRYRSRTLVNGEEVPQYIRK